MGGYMKDFQQHSTHDHAMQIEKKIYASRQRKTKDQVAEILQLEIETHIKKHPDLVYDKLSEPVRNSDLSMTYIIHFKKA